MAKYALALFKLRYINLTSSICPTRTNLPVTMLFTMDVSLYYHDSEPQSG